MISKKFKNVPLEEDTRLLYQKESNIGNYDILYQKWNWEGIKAESIIFSNDDVSAMKHDEIERLVRTSPFVKEGSQMTIKRIDAGFTFCNFNFETT